MKIWRIAAATRQYAADDLSGTSSAKHPGRWNDLAQPVVYAAPAISMAVLETAAHIDDGGLPLNRYLIEIDVSDAVWALRETLTVEALPPTWDAVPAGQASVSVGTAWLASVRSPILLVPSVIVPEEQVALLNPRHPASARIKARVARQFEYSRLLRR